jgi:predicted  nucleic acid-binding Zn-ribbon protein
MSAVDDALQAVDGSWAGYSEAETLAQEFRWACDDLARARTELDRRADEITELGNKLIAAHRRIAELEAGEVRTGPWTTATPENPS